MIQLIAVAARASINIVVDGFAIADVFNGGGAIIQIIFEFIFPNCIVLCG